MRRRLGHGLEELGWSILPDGKDAYRWFVLRLKLAAPVFWLARRLAMSGSKRRAADPLIQRLQQPELWQWEQARASWKRHREGEGRTVPREEIDRIFDEPGESKPESRGTSNDAH